MTIITNEGKKLITHSIINKLDLFISKVVYADCNLDMLDENTTTLTNIKYENLPTSVRIDEFDNSKIIFETVLRNDTAQDFFINCVGFVAKNGELLCFTKMNRTFVQSAVNNTNASLFHYKLAMKPKNAKDLSIKIDETIVYPTLAHFNASQKAQDELIAKLALDKVNISDFTASQKAQDEKIKTLETDKADKLNVFTRDEINVKLSAKADKTTTYTKTEVDTSQNAQNTTISTNHTSVLTQLALQNTQVNKLMTQCQNLLTKIELGGGKVGMIFMYAGATIPSNYMLCDGRELLKIAYPQLFKVIGITYGESADKLKFKIPDLRGKFVRCVGGNAAALGGVQGDAIRKITASIVTTHSIFNRSSGAFFHVTGKGNSIAGAGENTGFANNYFNFDASRVVPTANENRPINMSMNFIIQVKE